VPERKANTSPSVKRWILGSILSAFDATLALETRGHVPPLCILKRFRPHKVADECADLGWSRDSKTHLPAVVVNIGGIQFAARADS
jgi:hypothetical protein